MFRSTIVGAMHASARGRARGGRGGGRGGGGFDWRRFVRPSADPAVVSAVRAHIQSFKASGETHRLVHPHGAEERNTFRAEAASLQCGWDKGPQKHSYWLTRWVSDEAASSELQGTAQISTDTRNAITNESLREALAAYHGRMKWGQLAAVPNTVARLRPLWQVNDLKHAILACAPVFEHIAYDRKGLWLRGVQPDAVFVEVDERRVADAVSTLENLLVTSQRSGDRGDDRRRESKGNFRFAPLPTEGVVDVAAQMAEQRASIAYADLLPQRQRLPVSDFREEICRCVREHQVAIVVGATGCGKTTQVPQYILEDEAERGRPCRVVCTQPRRISAVSVAQRVAMERGVAPGSQVGYQVRFEAVASKQTPLFYCTVGILLRHLLSNPTLENVTHVVVDEVHERDVHTDFLLLALKMLVAKRPDLKVVLMSATVDPSKFISYFSGEDCEDGKGASGVAVARVPGKTNYPIEELFLEDIVSRGMLHPAAAPSSSSRRDGNRGGSRGGRDRSSQPSGKAVPYEQFVRAGVQPPSLEAIAAAIDADGDRAVSIVRAIDEHHRAPIEAIDFHAVARLVEHIHATQPEGAILIFLTGWFEISEVVSLLKKQRSYAAYDIFPLHSMMPTAEQQRIFRPAPTGRRKVIVATNIAETSITVEDVVYVIDAGKIKHTEYNPQTGIAALSTGVAPKANGQQRRGRAGRCRPGVWFRLYTSFQWAVTPEVAVPEMQRTPTEELLLQVKSMRIGSHGANGPGGAEAVLNTAMDPPPVQAIQRGLETLRSIGALDGEDESLTHLGWKLAELPLHPVLGKLALYGAVFGCLERVLTIAASLGYKSPFYLPMGEEARADAAKAELAQGLVSDHMLLLRAFEQWQSLPTAQRWTFCRRYYLSNTTLTYIQSTREDIARLVSDFGIHTGSITKNPQVALSAAESRVLEAVLSAGLHPARMVHKRRESQLVVPNGSEAAACHPGSLSSRRENSDAIRQYHFAAYMSIQRTTKLFCYDVTPVRVLPMTLFAPTATQMSPTLLQLNRQTRQAVQFSTSGGCDVVRRLRHLLHSELLPRVVGRAMQPAHRQAVDTVLQLLHHSDEAAAAASDSDDEDGGYV